jgi:ubiquinone/menaquinone biosynthesis C-methylase UbiE
MTAAEHPSHDHSHHCHAEHHGSGKCPRMNPETYNSTPGARENAVSFAQRIESKIALHSTLVALDFGAGTGLVSLQLLPKVGKVYVLDPFKDMLDKFEADVASTGLRNFEICNGSLNDFTFPPLDMVTCSLSLHHTPDVKDALQKIFNTLKPGGHLFVVEVVAHVINLDDFSRDLKAVGFTNIESLPHGRIQGQSPNAEVVVQVETVFFSAQRPEE